MMVPYRKPYQNLASINPYRGECVVFRQRGRLKAAHYSYIATGLGCAVDILCNAP